MIGTKKAAELLNISARRVRKLIAQGRVYGAYKVGGNWIIPTVCQIALKRNKMGLLVTSNET